jgi:S-adenosylmethionine hydrolase
LTPEQQAEIEKAERMAEKKVEKIEVPKVVEVPKPVEVEKPVIKTVEVPKIIEKPKLVKEEELTPEELKRLKPEEFEEEEIPPERRVEFRETLGKVITSIKEKAVPKIKAGIRKN